MSRTRVAFGCTEVLIPPFEGFVRHLQDGHGLMAIEVQSKPTNWKRDIEQLVSGLAVQRARYPNFEVFGVRWVEFDVLLRVVFPSQFVPVGALRARFLRNSFFGESMSEILRFFEVFGDCFPEFCCLGDRPEN